MLELRSVLKTSTHTHIYTCKHTQTYTHTYTNTNTHKPYTHINSNCSVHDAILETLHELATRQLLSNVSLLTQDLHVLPDFLGNRSPLADPSMRGMVSPRHTPPIFETMIFIAEECLPVSTLIWKVHSYSPEYCACF